jgi:hypothetical protein
LAERLLEGEYPHVDSRNAIDKILAAYQNSKCQLLRLDHTASPETVLEYCRSVNIDLVRLKIFLGFLLRSANLRNAFEQYFPIKILASELLGDSTALVLSSEWSFSPYTYPLPLNELPDFVFVGLPASECQNPLVLPLAGHELGHVVWRRKGAKQEFDAILKTKILDLYKENWDEFRNLFQNAPLERNKLETDLFTRSIWIESYKLAQRQLEEVFCDFMGVYVFGASFCHSFRYLLAPSLGYTRAANYPKLRDRARYLLHIANIYGVTEFGGYEQSFSEEEQKHPPPFTFILKIADRATDVLYERLVDLVSKFCGRAEKFDVGSPEEERIGSALKALVPAAAVSSMAAVINAAWKIRLDLDGWDVLNDIQDPLIQRKEKLRVLEDLVLKSFEVYEYRKRLERYAP